MVAGIYGDISVQAFSDLRIDYVSSRQRHHAGRCAVDVSAECDVEREGDYDVSVQLGDASVSRRVHLGRGVQAPSVTLEVKRPRLWWPNGYGEQHLYDLVVSVGSHAVQKRIGLRTLTVVNREDAAGLSMTFRVNGVDMFCKGANWIPFDALPSRQTERRLDHLLASAAAANMNMLRVWGGGQYESDAFYSLCDSKGLLVWHDMMFSCSLYPATPGFLANVEREIRHQVKRLRDHPCIALWCGNNEDVGALTWFPESRRNRDRYLVDYDRLNEGVIGRVVDECDRDRGFWPSSPSAGRGDYSDNWHADGRGDMHYWSVWHEGKNFGAYYDVKPRFCSEFGYQSFPSMGTIRTYAAPADWNVTAPVMEHHQRHPRGNSIITEMFTRSYRMPEDFESFVYLSQVQQAMAITTAVEYWRRLRPHCMGTLYWQLNDTWPVCSWSSLEYDGTWKLLHYAARRFFAPILLAAQVIEGRLEVWLTSDRTEEVSCRATVRVMDFAGKVVSRDVAPVRMRAGSARMVKAVKLSEIAPRPERVFLSLVLEHEGTRVVNDIFLTEPKRCALGDPRVSVRSSSTRDGFAVRLSSDAPAFHAALSVEGIPGEFSDNFFTILPGEPRTVGFVPRRRVSLERFRRALALRHLRETYR
jgi:beta-mannosidase